MIRSTRKSMTKFMLVMMELIIFIILEVHANDSTVHSSALTPPRTSLHPFQLDNENKTYIHHCIESTIEVCEKRQHMMMCVGHLLFKCLFKDPRLHGDNPLKLHAIMEVCIYDCLSELEASNYLKYAGCLVNHYEEYIKL
jgi:hypothetical protein